MWWPWREWAQANGIDLTVVGPEAPLALVWWMSSVPTPACLCSGPTRAAAQLESSRPSPGHSCSATASPPLPTTPSHRCQRSPRLHRPHGSSHCGEKPMVWPQARRGGGHDLAEAHEAVDFPVLEGNKFGVQVQRGRCPCGDRGVFRRRGQLHRGAMASPKAAAGHPRRDLAPSMPTRAPTPVAGRTRPRRWSVRPEVHDKAMRGNHPA